MPGKNGTPGSLTLWGGVAVDPATNQAFVVQSDSGVIQVINLTALPTAAPANIMKSAEITEVIVPTPPNPGPGAIGGLPNAPVPQATLASTSHLPAVQIFGSGFSPGRSEV